MNQTRTVSARRHVANVPARQEVEGVLRQYLVDTDSAIPKYAHLRQALSQAIKDGVWTANARLPTEQELTKVTPFSLGTVQRAIKALVEEGQLVRIKGRGTFVTAQARGIAQPFFHARFLDDSGENLLPVYPRVIAKSLIREQGPWSKLLNQRGRNIFKIERILSINKEFDVFSQFYINAERFPSFVRKPTAELTSGNYKLMLSREFNLPPLHYEQAMEIAMLPLRVTRILSLSARRVGGILLVIARTTPTSSVYYHELFIPPNGRRLRLPEMILPTGR